MKILTPRVTSKLTPIDQMIIDNGQQGSIGEIRKLAKYRLKHIDKYYERSGVQFLHGQRPLAFTELKRIALDLKD
ncbi:hypothetical protein K6732_08455, partial [Escherichia marmotae]|nr:hypothetical protein [Escherichia marmotae]